MRSSAERAPLLCSKAVVLSLCAGDGARTSTQALLDAVLHH